ncbi:hypothetical protein ACFQ3P_42610 [Paraburkholderia sabiae]|uniref:hypothetical protein n=1 Tax=Paraburkholderia sabiae TaxID=273251 RepID=UPI00319DC4DE
MFDEGVITPVVIGRIQSNTAEVAADHRHLGTGSDELNSDAVTPRVRCDPFCRERWNLLRS